MRVAAIGIGSNSVRMLIADVEGDHGARLRREREGTRLFAGLDSERRLSEAAMETTVRAVAGMAASARASGAEQISLFATSATRDATNSAVFAERLRDAAGLELQITPGEEEALLSYLGASDGPQDGVIDIGGGSTEVIFGEGLTIHEAFSCQMGAVRLSRLQPIATVGELRSVERMAKELLEKELATRPSLHIPEAWIGTGGTFTTLAAMYKSISWNDRTYMHGTVLPRAWVEETAERLAVMPMEERLRLRGLQPNRADIVVHGIAILLACMHRMDIGQIKVSEYGNLDGYIKKTYRLTGGLTA